MGYYLIAIITLISALLVLLFSVQAVRAGKDVERTNALYMFARSAALLCAAVVPLVVGSDNFLLLITGIMLIVQMIDGFAGIYIKNPMRTVGPFVMACLHAGCLFWSCRIF